MSRGDSAVQREALFLLAVISHAGAIRVDLVVAPGMFDIFPRLNAALVNRRRPRGAHAGLAAFAALREARRRHGRRRKPQGQRRSHISFQSDHDRSPYHCCANHVGLPSLEKLIAPERPRHRPDGTAPFDVEIRTRGEIASSARAALLQGCPAPPCVTELAAAVRANLTKLSSGRGNARGWDAPKMLVPQGGFEPSTYRLRSDCSAVELLRRPQAGLVAKKAAAVEAGRMHMVIARARLK
jgi:hypothetical protein